MNDSGVAVAALARRYLDTGSDALGDLVVVHDELDLPPGVVRIKSGGGTAGHNGLKSLHAHLHSLDFVRVRIGVGKPPGTMTGASYVLRRPGRADASLLAVAIEVAADAVELIARVGVAAAMNTVNAR
jgi:PTH1 family peptidyl-tRNA hydrolase